MIAAHATTARRRARSRGGFTLLELILAMGIAAMISLSIYLTFSSAYRARSTILRASGPAHEAAIALDLIEADLANVLPPADTSATTDSSGTTSGSGTTTALFGPMVGEQSGGGTGATDELSFFAIGRDPTRVVDNKIQTPTDVFAEGVRQVAFGVAPGPDGRPALMRRVIRNVLASSAATPEEEPLAGGVQSLIFEYYDGSDWTDTWNSDDQGYLLPLAVRVTLTIAIDDPRNPGQTYQMTRLIPISCASATALANRGTTS